MKIGVSRQTVIAIEKRRYVPSLNFAFHMARLFGVPVDETFTNEEDLQPLSYQ